MNSQTLSTAAGLMAANSGPSDGAQQYGGRPIGEQTNGTPAGPETQTTNEETEGGVPTSLSEAKSSSSAGRPVPRSAARTTSASAEPTGLTASAGIALGALGLIVLLAFDFFRTVDPSPADKITLLFLGVVAAVLLWTPLRRHFDNRDAASYALTAAFFVIYSMARRAGPDEGWNVHMATLPDDVFVVSWSARIALAAALVSLGISREFVSPLVRSALIAFFVLGTFTVGTYIFLGRHYPVGPTNEVDPLPLMHTLLQLIEYGAVAALCGVVGANAQSRRFALHALPAILLALWARHQFAAVPEEEDEA